MTSLCLCLLFLPLIVIGKSPTHCEGLTSELGGNTMLSACLHNGAPVFDIRHFFVEETLRPTIKGEWQSLSFWPLSNRFLFVGIHIDVCQLKALESRLDWAYKADHYYRKTYKLDQSPCNPL